MRLVEVYSHLNGKEHILVHKKRLWNEIETVIDKVNAKACRTKVSKEKRKASQGLLYSPIELNRAFKKQLQGRDWHEDRVSYWVTSNADLVVQTMNMPPEQQRQS